MHTCLGVYVCLCVHVCFSVSVSVWCLCTCMRVCAYVRACMCAQVAEWLCDASGPATYLNMDESHRPVKLRKVVLGFPCGPNQNDFKFDLSLNYKMANIVQTYSDQKPALVVGGSFAIHSVIYLSAV